MTDTPTEPTPGWWVPDRDLTANEDAGSGSFADQRREQEAAK